MRLGLILITLYSVAPRPTLAKDDPSHRLRALSEKLASDLRESRRCEVNPDNGYTRCTYSYVPLRFSRVTWSHMSSRLFPFIEIESLGEGHVSVQFYGGRCLSVNLSSDDPSDLASAFVNVADGKISADFREAGCGHPVR
jgi:hypothetical protein